MKKISVLFVLLLLLFGSSCKKTDLPEEETGDPVFSLRGKYNGEDISMQAGNNYYYMTASHFQNSDNVYVFKGDLRQTICPDNICGYGLAVMIDDYKRSELNGSMYIDSAVHTGPYHFFKEPSPATHQVLEFVPLVPLGDNDTYNWTFTDGTETITAPQTYSLSKSLLIGKTYTVSMNFDDGEGGCNATHSNVFRVGNPFQTTITAQNTSDPKVFNFSTKTSVAGTYTYLWEFGDGGTSISAAPNHSFASEGTYTVKLTIKNANQETCEAYYQVYSGTGTVCHANFNTKFLPLQVSELFKTITIELTEPNGVVYSTDGVLQPANSYANIRVVKDYGQKNKAGERTKELHLLFDCMLKNGNETRSLSDAEAVIAISYR